MKCDATSGTCVVAPRPAAPSGYGASCGLVASSVAPSGEQIVPGATCAICHVDYAGSGCVMQACSMACTFDDDCPDGSVCVCGVGGTSGLDAGGGPAWSFCAAITDRTTAAGRTAWLKCP